MALLPGRLLFAVLVLLPISSVLRGEEARRPTGVPIADGRRHWAFQPLQKLAAPTVSQPAWVSRPTDAWVLAALDREGLHPSAPASRPVLIRRLTFDLLGLPPTPDEIEAFEHDFRPDAYARLVDRLLRSPAYGQHRARFWLDLARYCDIPEGWIERKSQAYLYRDWVIAALNDDMPFDRFVRLQLAADRVADARPGDMAALGFLGLSPDYWKELQLNKDIIRGIVADEWEERIGTTSATFLGLTVACARCHDHKFEPITTRDYYALAGVMASTRMADRELLPEPAATRVRQARAEVASLEVKIVALQKIKPAQRAKAATRPVVATQSAAPATQPDIPAQIQALRDRIKELDVKNPELAQPAAPGVDDAALYVIPASGHGTTLDYHPGQSIDVCVQQRGNPTHEGPIAPRRFLEVLSPQTPRPLTTGSGRIDLADAIVNEAAPLTARVIVNRVWKQHFGRGIVETPSDFGFQGDRPTHPELLSDLAARFVEHHWSLRWLHGEILLSSAYQQSSAAGDAQLRIDPDNRWLGRMNRRRLDAEGWRDAMLAVSGTLDPAMGGPSQDLSDAANHRRTIYGTVKRADMNDFLRLNDFPDPLERCPVRVPTTTPLQSLFTLNGPMILQQSTAFAQRLVRDSPSADPAARIQRAFMLAYGHRASAAQVQRIMTFLTHGNPGGPITDATWQEFAQVILGSNEFQFVD